MNQYYLIHRLRGPAILLLIGLLALLHVSGVVERPFHLFWPLLLILLGVLMLAERAALAAEGGYPIWPFSSSNHEEDSVRGMRLNQEQGNSITPTSPHDSGKDSEGGQS